MDHQDWPGWPEDGSHPADGEPLHDSAPDFPPPDNHQLDHHLDHLVEPVPADQDLPPADHDLSPADQDGGEAPVPAAHTEHLSAAFPDDDPFAAIDHDPDPPHHDVDQHALAQHALDQHALDRHVVEPVDHADGEPGGAEPPADVPVGADPDAYADGDWVDGYLPP